MTVDVLLLLLYAGFCGALSATGPAPSGHELPRWMGANSTPHGALLSRSAGRWIITIGWAAFFTVLISTGHLASIPGLDGVAAGFALFLWLLGLAALGHRLRHGPPAPPPLPDEDELAPFDRFRILIRDPGLAGQDPHVPTLGRLCVDARVSAKLRDTPYTFLKELTGDSLRAARQIAPALLYQPVQPEITEFTDEHIATLQQEVHAHADRALAAQADRQRAEEKATRLEERTVLLTQSEKQARDDLERIRTRSRTAIVSKAIEQMTDRELEEHYRSLMAETRKVNLLRQNRAGGVVRQEKLPLINP